jgi:hypothetical protein
VNEALLNAEEALVLYAEAAAKEGRNLPRPRPLSELRGDSAAAADLKDHMVALVPLRTAARKPLSERPHAMPHCICQLTTEPHWGTHAEWPVAPSR